MTHTSKAWPIAAALLLSAAAAQAAVVTAVGSIPGGTAAFDLYASTNPAAAGGTATLARITGVTANDPPSFTSAGATITSANPDPNQPLLLAGGSDTTGGVYKQMTGQAFAINPELVPANGAAGDPRSYRGSGLKITLNQSVNYFGIEIGDWGTCCQPTSLYFSFGEPPTNGGPDNVYRIGTIGTNSVDIPNNSVGGTDYSQVFVSALADFSFTTIYVWGDGANVSGTERLLAGGTVRFANVGTPTPPNPAPAPATLALALLGMTALWATRRRQA